jgi:uncharacterized protein YukE
MPAGFMARAVLEAGRALHEANMSAGQGFKIAVNEHNILKAAGIIAAEAQRFRAEINDIAQQLFVGRLGADPVSAEAARVLNIKFLDGPESYVGRCRQRAEMLEELAEQLKKSAESYRMTEDHIESQLRAALTDALTEDDAPNRGTGGLRAV